jgi:hypothetical protein
MLHKFKHHCSAGRSLRTEPVSGVSAVSAVSAASRGPPGIPTMNPNVGDQSRRSSARNSASSLCQKSRAFSAG